VTGQSEPAGPPSAARFDRVRRVRSFEEVVEQVRAAITSRSIEAGERLPSERELAEQFGVSRATLREALRALEALGLLEIRLGAHGGAFATSPDDEWLTATLSGLLGVRAGTRRQEFRVLRATFHADNAYWAGHMAAPVQPMIDSLELGTQTFLVAIAHATGNPFRQVLADAIERAVDSAMDDGRIDQGSLRPVISSLQHHNAERARDLLYQLLAGDPEARLRHD
jgi:DNA-binding FadR family transcriptional regulator